MTSFLSWLWSVAQRVYAWFGDRFDDLYKGAANAWSWAVGQASAALSAAKSYAYSLFKGFLNDLSGLEDWIDYQLDLLRKSISALEGLTWSDIEGWIDAQLSDLWDRLTAIAGSISSAISKLWSDVLAWVAARISDALAAVGAIYGWVNTVRAGILALISFFTPARIAQIVDLIETQLVNIKQFFANPVGFMLDLLWPVVTHFLSYAIAYSLGTTKSDLPPVPKWGK